MSIDLLLTFHLFFSFNTNITTTINNNNDNNKKKVSLVIIKRLAYLLIQIYFSLFKFKFWTYFLNK